MHRGFNLEFHPRLFLYKQKNKKEEDKQLIPPSHEPSLGLHIPHWQVITNM